MKRSIYENVRKALRAPVYKSMRTTWIRMATSATALAMWIMIPTEALRDIIIHLQMLLKLIIMVKCIHISIISGIPTAIIYSPQDLVKKFL